MTTPYNTPEEHDDDLWVDADAGPVVRPYAIARGRTEPLAGDFDLITIVVAGRTLTAADVGLGPEHHALVELCQQPQSVAELSAFLDLPVGIVRVLLGDLLGRMLIRAHNPNPAATPPSDDLFEAVIRGIRQL
ncbi:DUF742 domain-containing protein [Dactylosporangium sp. CA-139066]|uniref:DUF742 domain-containing protein n=1 Tax=Dactylosporangium sp. CA-139066 TaxID=3239930 RepID=UPI003D94126A